MKKLSHELKELEINLASARIIELDEIIGPLQEMLKEKNKLLKKNTSKKKVESHEFDNARENYLNEKRFTRKNEK